MGKEYEKNGFNKLDQFKTSAALLVGILYTKLKSLRGEEIDQFFYPQFEEKEGNPICFIQLLKRQEIIDQKKESQLDKPE